jgi:hypothetical protein
MNKMKKIELLCAAVLIAVFSQTANADYGKSFFMSRSLKVTSYEAEVNKKYPLYNMFDADLDNTFVYNSNKDIRLDFQVRGKEDILSLEIINGFSKNKALYYANNIITKIKVSGAGGFVQIYPLAETLLPQKISLPKPFKKITINVEGIKKGGKYDDTCISSIKIFNSSNKDILADDSFFLYSDAGEYPDYSLVDKREGVLQIYKNDMLHHALNPIDFSPDGTEIYFFEGESVNYGLLIYDFKKRKDNMILKGKYIKRVNWVNNNRIVVDWMVIDGEKRTNGQSILSIRDFN